VPLVVLKILDPIQIPCCLESLESLVDHENLVGLVFLEYLVYRLYLAHLVALVDLLYLVGLEILADLVVQLDPCFLENQMSLVILGHLAFQCYHPTLEIHAVQHSLVVLGNPVDLAMYTYRFHLDILGVLVGLDILEIQSFLAVLDFQETLVCPYRIASLVFLVFLRNHRSLDNLDRRLNQCSLAIPVDLAIQVVLEILAH